MDRQVGIIGAGVSGLLACKYVLKAGYNPIVFEAKTSIGGVWAHTSETTKLQNHKQQYEFLDFPWPSSVKEDFPDHNQVMDYLESYARQFDLQQYIRFNCRVMAIDYEGVSDEEMVTWDLWGGTGDPIIPKGKWNITVEDTQIESTELEQVYQVEFVILCIGKFSDLPNIPDFPPNKGPESFNGKVIHSMDYSAMDDASAAKFIKGKRVAVVGIQKSGLDIATECAMANGIEHPCTVIYKRAHWNFPDFFPWGVPLAFLYFNRLAEFMIHKPGEGLILSLLATLLSPLRWLISKFVESYIRWKLPLKKYNMMPKHSWDKDFSAGTISITPEKFYHRVDEGSIILKKSTTFSFWKDGVMISDNNERIETDLVILATGYKGDQKLKNIFASPTFQKYIMGSSKSTVQLYRECIHPRIPQLAIIGYLESLMNLFTSEIRCIWLTHLLKGTFKLPRIIEMEKDVLRWERYMTQNTSEYYRRSCQSVMHIWYNDQLCRDMRFNPKRKKGFFVELLQPYGSKDYEDLSTH
ncbi:hypothetical protein AQUCO_01500479v1 [Aquilegia coerulea]|uniref:Flavin-containing monooxygenase n=1 Tax=Aquilegia coerulea TaxID=218851 RepID=A0A2G5DU43_AQUCA|nr:hypothetical protein AQUCO_01500479v1 [Aquilegia coerulea]